MNILVSGSSGLIGSALIPALTTAGHHVVKLRRSSSKPDDPRAFWDPVAGHLDLNRAGPLDAVVHLAGETIGGRWSPAKKLRIRQSRVAGTRLLCETLTGLQRPPEVLICASATGYYGHRGQAWLDEKSAAGTGFLAEVCREWEAATQPAADHGIRVVNMRFGIVLSPAGGALAKMLPAFRLGLGGQLGSGQHYWSWILIEDAVGAIHHAIVSPGLSGPVNAASPEPVANLEFTRTLGAVLHRPTFLAVPSFVIRLILGEMGQEALLASARVRPAKLVQSGFIFRFPSLELALRHVLEKSPRSSSEANFSKKPLV